MHPLGWWFRFFTLRIGVMANQSLCKSYQPRVVRGMCSCEVSFSSFLYVLPDQFTSSALDMGYRCFQIDLLLVHLIWSIGASRSMYF